MSFEGYYQIICKNGHYYNEDVYAGDIDGFRCPICDAKVAWWNIVDLTYDSFDEDGNQIDGYIPLEIDVKAPECTCEKCGNVHTIGYDTYKIPVK